MRLRWFCVLAVLASISSVAASAQAVNTGKFDEVYSFAAGSNLYRSTSWFDGPAAGASHNFHHFGTAAFGADLRGSYLFRNPRRYRGILFGVRFAARPALLPIRPYLQASIGAGGKMRSGPDGSGTISTHKLQYQLLGGAECSLSQHIDWRIAELGYGTAIASALPSSGVNLFVVDTGLVVRFP